MRTDYKPGIVLGTMNSGMRKQSSWNFFPWWEMMIWKINPSTRTCTTVPGTSTGNRAFKAGTHAADGETARRPGAAARRD